MAHLAVETGDGSSDVNSSAWVPLDADFGNPRESESWGQAQVARAHVWFTDPSETATLGFALVGDDGVVYAYFEGYAVAGARRTDADNGGGNYVGRINFQSTTAPTAYAADYRDKIDLMQGKPEDYGTNQPLHWRAGIVTAPSAGTVYAAISTSPVV